MKSPDKMKSPQPIPGRKRPPVPWDDRKGAGMTAGELLVERVGNLIEEK